MVKILFVCHGNICRSPMAQFVMQKLVNDKGLHDVFEIDSAATSREEIGNGVHYGTIRKLQEVGIDCGEHFARQVTKADYDYYDYLIVMDKNNIRNIQRIIPNDPMNKIHTLLSYAKMNRDIADPWYTGNFDQTYDDVVIGCEALLKEIIEKFEK